MSVTERCSLTETVLCEALMLFRADHDRDPVLAHGRGPAEYIAKRIVQSEGGALSFAVELKADPYLAPYAWELR